MNSPKTLIQWLDEIQERINELISRVNSIFSIPSGGDAGQVLTKTSGTDYDVEWSAPEAVAKNGIPEGGTAGQFLAKKTESDFDVEWKDVQVPDDYVKPNSDNVFTGSNEFTKPLKIVDGLTDDDAVTRRQLGELADEVKDLANSAVTKTGAQTISGVKTFSVSPSVPTPTNPGDAASKQYVDEHSSGGSGSNEIWKPSVSPDGEISWEKSSDSSTPDPVNIRGPQGQQGPAGSEGPQGQKGDTGAQGEPGPKGDTGPQGPAGKDGVTPEFQIGSVTTGEPGTDASVDAENVEGLVILDFTIPRGDKGQQGTQGPAGADGQQGPEGPQGPRGDTGPQGPQGPQGQKGDTGAQGEPGPKGDTGPQGPAGKDGVGVPAGGTAGQVLAKKTGTDYDTEWVDQTGGGGGGGGNVFANLNELIGSFDFPQSASHSATNISVYSTDKPEYLFIVGTVPISSTYVIGGSIVINIDISSEEYSQRFFCMSCGGGTFGNEEIFRSRGLFSGASLNLRFRKIGGSSISTSQLGYVFVASLVKTELGIGTEADDQVVTTEAVTKEIDGEVYVMQRVLNPKTFSL